MHLIKGQCGIADEGGRAWEVRLEVSGPERQGLGEQCSHFGFYSEMGNHWKVLSRKGHQSLVTFLKDYS